MIYEFLDNEIIKVKYINGEVDEKILVIYIVVLLREKIYVIDFIWLFEEIKLFIIVIDLNKNIVMILIVELFNKEEVVIFQFERGDKGLLLILVKVEFEYVLIDIKFSSDIVKYKFISDLIGKRILFKYSLKDVYEYIYLNENYYIWYCVSGIEKGFCDIDRCFYLKIEENLYWFIWLERVVLIVGIVVEDLDLNKMCLYGKIYGYELYEMGKVINFLVGLYVIMLNRIEY